MQGAEEQASSLQGADEQASLPQGSGEQIPPQVEVDPVSCQLWTLPPPPGRMRVLGLEMTEVSTQCFKVGFCGGRGGNASR